MISDRGYKRRVAVVLTVVLLGGCAANPQTGQLELAPEVKNDIAAVQAKLTDIYDNPDPCSNNSRNIGLTIGALVGTYVGHRVDTNKTEGLVAGAGVGALLGGLIGHNMDARRCELSKIAKQYDLRLASTAITPEKLGEQTTGQQSGTAEIGTDVLVQAGQEFNSGSGTMTPKAQAAFSAIAKQYRPDVVAAGGSQQVSPAALEAAKRRKVLIVGHADEGDDPEKAAQLSEERARVVAQEFVKSGVPAENIYYQGAGDTLPVADNATAKGRAENRRIQVVDVPSEDDLQQYLKRRTPSARNFAVAERSTVGAPPRTAPSTVPPRSISRPSRARQGVEYDFGGSPFAGGGAVDLGASVETSMFNVIKTANAAEPVIVGPCTKDRPHVATSIKNLATGRQLQIRDAIPGLYGAPITGMMNGNLIAALNPYAPQDAGVPVPDVKLEIYRDYSRTHDRRPTFEKDVPVNVYRGANATLYRIFVTGPVECMDIVVPKQQATNQGRALYRRENAMYLAEAPFITKR